MCLCGKSTTRKSVKLQWLKTGMQPLFTEMTPPIQHERGGTELKMACKCMLENKITYNSKTHHSHHTQALFREDTKIQRRKAKV